MRSLPHTALHPMRARGYVKAVRYVGRSGVEISKGGLEGARSGCLLPVAMIQIGLYLAAFSVVQRLSIHPSIHT